MRFLLSISFIASVFNVKSLRLKQTWAVRGDGICLDVNGVAVDSLTSSISDFTGNSVEFWQNRAEEEGMSWILLFDKVSNYFEAYMWDHDPCTSGNHDGAGDVVLTLYGPTPHSTAQGDPHCSNAQGEKFDIKVLTSRIPMIVIPQNSSIDTASCAISAETTPNVFDECAPPYLNNFEVRTTSCTLRLVVGGAEMPTAETTPDWDEKTCNQEISFRSKGDSVFVKVLAAGLTMRIFQRQKEHGEHIFKFLNIYVSGSALLDAGGILGKDPHDWFSSNPAKICTRSLRDVQGEMPGSYAQVVVGTDY